MCPCHSAAATPEILYRFIGGEDGANPVGVIAGSAGVLYGTTCNGGSSDSGAVYSLTAPPGGSGRWTKSAPYSFMGTSDGAGPDALVLGAGGALYGTTALANQTTFQTAFSLTPSLSSGDPWTFLLLYNFTMPANAGGPIAIANGPNGVLYLTTRFGGTAGVGSVESLTPPAAPPGPWTLTVLHSFTDHTEFGAFPMSGVIVGAGGELYGTAQNGGLDGCPTCFSLTPPATPGGAWTEAILYNFSDSNSNDNYYPLVIGPGGVLYGTAALNSVGQDCCGIIYSLTPPANESTGGWTETTLYDFAGSPFDGGGPDSALIFGKDGTLFGTIYNGGTASFGAVAGLKPQSPTALSCHGGEDHMAHLRIRLVSLATLLLPLLFPHYSAAANPEILYSFSAGDGYPLGVIAGSAGVLYGTTCNGGTSDSGLVYSLTAPQGGSGSPWTKSVLYSFMGTSDGACPNTLVLGAGGVLYGTTTVDNQTASLTAFSLTPPQSAGNPWSFTLLYTFTEEEGSAIGLAIGADGVLYITSRFGGTGGVGSVMSLAPPSAPSSPWTMTVLHNFVFTEYGSYLSSGVIVGPGGELYGTAQNGGITGCPLCGIVYALFPPTSPGGTWPFKILYSMTPKASFPVGVAMGKGGVLYGVADEGGKGCPDCASVFSLTPPATPGGAWTEDILYTFSADDVNNSFYAVVIGPGGVLYGTANVPAVSQTCCGIVYSVTPPATGTSGSWTETTMHDFAGAPSDGSQPNSALIFGKGGTLFGTTGTGGTYNLGTVYGLKP